VEHVGNDEELPEVEAMFIEDHDEKSLEEMEKRGHRCPG